MQLTTSAAESCDEHLFHSEYSANSTVNETTTIDLTLSNRLMRVMISSLEAQHLMQEYLNILRLSLPCVGLELRDAEDKWSVGQHNEARRIMRIQVSNAMLTYRFHTVLTHGQRQMLSSMHSIFAMGITHALEYRRVQNLATKDPLTGLGNRTEFVQTLNKQISTQERLASEQGLELLVLDLDNFKQVNDTDGHAQGDLLLLDFSKIMQSSLRDADYAFRFGGDEFCCILTNCCDKTSALVAERVNQALSHNDIFKRYGVSVSIGSARYVEGDNHKSLFARADRALYAAKQAGKNRYSTAISTEG